MPGSVLIGAAVALIPLVLAAGPPQSGEVVLKIPQNWDSWILTDTVFNAQWMFQNRESAEAETEMKENIPKGFWQAYSKGTTATIVDRSSDCLKVRIRLAKGRTAAGWVVADLAETSPAEKARRLRAQQLAETRKLQEAQYVSSLPKLIGPGPKVVVATSLDCAKDLLRTVEFGRGKGTGVEFRKRMIELVSVGCAVTMDTGTPLVEATKDGQFVRGRAYGSDVNVVALTENVRWR